jgi:hypothetical protein
MKREKSEFYRAVVRARGLTDLNPLSRTAGCVDRSYWHYQDGKGFPVGSFQVAMSGFAAAALAFPEGASEFQRAAELTAGFWAKQIARGPLDEYFAGQQSFCATSHTTLSATLCLNLQEKGRGAFGDLGKAIETALGWMAQLGFRPDSANQTLAARLAWDLAAESSALGPVFRDRVNPFTPNENRDESWLSEYGGFDLGYSLQCLDLCALALGLLKNPARRGVYEQWARMLVDFLHAAVVEATFDPALSSRGNPHRLTGGVLAFAEAGDHRAKAIITELHGYETPALIGMDSCDDKYLVFFHLNSLLLAEHVESPLSDFFTEPVQLSESVAQPTWGRHLPSAGLLFFHVDTWRAAVSLTRGGLVAVSGRARAEVQGGYLLRDGRSLWTTVVDTDAMKIQKNESAQEVTLTLPLRLKRVSERTATVQHLGFRLALRLALAVPVVSDLLNRWILNKVSAGSKSSRPFAIRQITLSRAGVVVGDTFQGEYPNLFSLHHWNTTDGHSTRLFAAAEPAVTPVAAIAKGQVRTVNWRAARPFVRVRTA